MRRPERALAPLLLLLSSGCDFFELPARAAPSIVVTPTSGLTTTEAGGQATFTVRLGAQPTADVTIGLSSSRPSEGTVAPERLTFTPQNWNAPQTATVTGVDDSVADGDQAYTILTAPAASDDPAYAGLDPPDVQVTNRDDETPGFVVTPTSGLVTTEAGGKATFTVRLQSRPLADVRLDVSSSRPSEGTVAPASLTFTSANWNVARTVTVTGVDDSIVDGDQPYSIVLSPASSTDPAYAGLDPPDVSVTNRDDDTPGFTLVPPADPTTSEAGKTATFTIRLNTQPAAAVTIAVSSSDTTEGTVSPASLTFTPANWNVARTVTATGVDDAVADGNQPYAIVLSPAASADPVYAGLDPPDVPITNLDDDTPGVTVSPTGGLTTAAGGTASFTVVLDSQPTAGVTIAVASAAPDHGTAAPATLAFTASDWNVPQAVTVTGGAVAGAYTIVLSPAVSADSSYGGRDPPDVAVTNQP